MRLWLHFSLLILCCSANAMSTPELPPFDKLWDYGKPAETEARFRALLPKAREAGDPSYLCQLLTQIARTHSLRNSFDESHRLLDEAERLLRPELKLARVRYALERGRAFNPAGKREKARPLFLQAWEVAREAGEDYFAVDAAHMLGIVEPPAQALEWHLKALALAEASGEERAKGWLGPLYNNLGWTYFEQKEYARSLDLLRKALAWYEAKKLPEQVRIAKWSVAKLLRVHGKVEEALRTQEALHREREQLGKPDGYVFEELGECLLALDRSQEARPHFARAYELLSKDEWLVRAEPKRIERLKTLGGQ